MSSQTTHTILVTGATGTQGGAVINALLASPNISTYTILALTRSTSSPKAVSLTAKSPQIKLLKGDLDSPAAIFASSPTPITVVFSVQNNIFGSPEKHQIEETQAKALCDAAVANNVKHFIQSTGDRHGPAQSAVDPTYVPHFQTKYRIEQHLMQQASRSGMTYTILRPVSFMDNLTPDLHGKGFASMWHCMGDDRPLQLISARDIGVFAVKAIEMPDHPSYHNQAVSIAGDELTQVQADGVFRKVFGKPMPRTLALVGTVVKWTTPEVGSMFKWFAEVGFMADKAECKRLHPEIQDFEAWLRESSGFAGHEAGKPHD